MSGPNDYGPPLFGSNGRSVVPIRAPGFPKKEDTYVPGYSGGNRTSRVVVDSDTTPLELMLQVMRNPDLPLELRMKAADSAMPYVHQKLSPRSLDDASGVKIEVTGGLPLFGPDNNEKVG